MEFQSFKIMQDFKQVYMRRFFFFFFFFLYSIYVIRLETRISHDEI